MHEGLREAIKSWKQSRPYYISHVGKNDAPSEKTSQAIAQSTADLAKSITNGNLQVTVSSLVPRNGQWSKKVYEINKVLLNLCKDVNIPFISHSAIKAKRNLNNSKSHLNIRGSRKFLENFVKYLKGFSSCDNVTRNESEFCDGLSTKSKESFSTAFGESFFKEPELSTSIWRFLCWSTFK